MISVFKLSIKPFLNIKNIDWAKKLLKIKDTYFFKIIKKCFFDFFSLSEVKLDQKSDFDQILKKVKNSFFRKIQKNL